MPDSKNYHKLRLFLASPSDVAQEREYVRAVVNDLNKSGSGVADAQGIQFEVLGYDTHVSPNMGRPQGVTFDQLPPDKWDLFIGILWQRFGSPTGAIDPHTGKEFESGSIEEFTRAYELWKQHGAPRILFYRCVRTPEAANIVELQTKLAQLQPINDFFTQFGPNANHPGFYRTYQTPEDFKDFVRQDLTHIILNYGGDFKDKVVESYTILDPVPATIPNTLPRHGSFFGRKEEIDCALEALSPVDRGWGVVIDGIGGIGKTALAVEIAYICQGKSNFDIFIFLTAKREQLEPSGIQRITSTDVKLDTLLSECLRVLGQRVPSVQPSIEKKQQDLLDLLRGKRALVIFDNLETLTLDEQNTISRFLRKLPNECKAIVTSRHRVGESAVTIRLEKLNWEEAKELISSQIKRHPQDLNRLKIAGESRWKQLYDDSGGSPLGILWTIGLIRARGLSLDRAFELLKSGSDESDLYMFIYQEARKNMDDNELIALSALSLFDEPTTFEKLSIVTRLARRVLDTVLDRLCTFSLVNKVAVMAEQKALEECYILHLLIRRFVREDLARNPELEKKLRQNFDRDVDVLRRRYLQKLQIYCNLTPIAAIAEESDSHTNTRITLDSVYIGLNTTEFLGQIGDSVTREPLEMAHHRREVVRPLSVLEAAARNEALVILGDPGSGKTSFLDHLIFMLADNNLHPENVLPENWPHGPLLPVRVLLRELAITLEQKDSKSFLNLSSEARRREFSSVIHEHIAEHLVDYDSEDFAEALRAAIADGRCLIVFDGLDEVPYTLRLPVRLAVESFCVANAGNRYLVTCRLRSYEGAAILQAFKTVTIAPLDDAQIPAFIGYWYDSLAQTGKFSSNQAAAKKEDLKHAVEHLPQDMVRNPLLLTTLANVHTHSAELPRQRVKLYRIASTLLLKRWNEHKTGKISLFDRIDFERDVKIYRALCELGYSAQKAGQGQGAVDIPQAEAVSILMRHFSSLPNPLETAKEFLDFVDITAGLLIGRGGMNDSVYAFPHRMFQEYFAGCHLATGVRNFGRELLKLLPEGDYWRFTAQLGMEELLYNHGNDLPVIDAAYTLCPPQAPQLVDEEIWRGVLLSAIFVLEVGATRIALDNLPKGGVEFLNRLHARLVTILEKSLLSARECADAGFVLGKLGDPREGVCTLPPVWVELEGGKFTMGSKDGADDEKPPHEVEVSPFKISKYPITNAQFAEFMNAGGYHEQKWWSAEGWQYRQKENWEEPRLWRDENFNLPNQPVIGVSWFEAEAFCNWLTAKGEERGVKGEKIRLPTEAEWEFAARGKEGRKFPWGKDEPTSEHANYGKMINRPTAVGSYAKGATHEGIFDLAGNVWEWCFDFYDEKYYAACKKKGVVKNPSGPAEGNWRVVRGGAYYSKAKVLRGSRRNVND
ncbi:MAG: SUMF1/EgtB/PvdO family nonheme iron enzyme, partial [candidate division KSB1 bacterium]